MKFKILFTAVGTAMLCVANAFSLYYSDAIVNKEKYSVYFLHSESRIHQRDCFPQ